MTNYPEDTCPNCREPYRYDDEAGEYLPHRCCDDYLDDARCFWSENNTEVTHE